MHIFSLCIGVLAFAACCTYFCISWGRGRLLDTPNQRSSHSVPTPRGGGIGIVAGFFGGLVVASQLQSVTNSQLFSLACGLLIAGIGFADDIVSLSVRIRLLVQSLTAALVLWTLPPLPDLIIFGLTVPLYLAIGLYFFLIVWMTNLYNFMDGIDGIAAGQAVAIGLSWSAIAMSVNINPTIPALFSASAAGFLIFNYPPAKIFMGDVGSAFCGFIVAVVAFILAGESNTPVLLWLLPASPFIWDATITLFVRFARRANPGQAHRSHAYQRSARSIGRHLPVSLGYTFSTLLWFGPITWLTINNPAWPVEAVFLLSGLPYIIWLFCVRAGYDN